MGVHRSADATVSAQEAAAVTPSDATIIPTTRALYVGVAGNVTVRMAGNATNVTFVSVANGILPIQVDMVLSTGTAATDIVALY